MGRIEITNPAWRNLADIKDHAPTHEIAAEEHRTIEEWTDHLIADTLIGAAGVLRKHAGIDANSDSLEDGLQKMHALSEAQGLNFASDMLENFTALSMGALWGWSRRRGIENNEWYRLADENELDHDLLLDMARAMGTCIHLSPLFETHLDHVSSHNPFAELEIKDDILRNTQARIGNITVGRIAEAMEQEMMAQYNGG